MTKCIFYLSAFCCRGRTVKRRFSCVSARQQKCCKYEKMTSREAGQLKPFAGNPLPFSDSVWGLILKSVFPWVLIFIHHHDVARLFFIFFTLRLSMCIFMHHTISCKIIRPWILGIENKQKNSWLTLSPFDSPLIIKFICCKQKNSWLTLSPFDSPLIIKFICCKLLALMLKLPACGCVVIHASLEVWKFGTTEPWHNVMHSVWKDQLFQALINSLVCVCVCGHACVWVT